ncbi:PVC-type heme-binding CxxCH protein [Tuwongella immobilis]|uniref:Cytochrome c domain-containing protein n=1 Tax=Tuwongella immobilis TaxID=692036 RepID=A0A6C2YLD8_9BACT|nr:PVC-type heme-binding CxxCH protein [Tuwongella immobilis]VIP01915.1 membrane-bound dehydrogenase domain protein : Membrane-bound dehydrogenase domain protein OS=Pedosphaera parvula (strain Ellin514) GN=Cflav_PD4923 PE=4 SV=1: Cytochrom_C [Tuwongella immobilis]VTR99833.1 membrane-bound dehydrogenase domain protein : Membrane-bound dehydrogenase domain protein OS=Pedosphaera parvula (strain Ellin514) GN=Cflav_PD4923 PE=4 SV=1: Cytochrom_C [Tuwongella immobilis]
MVRSSLLAAIGIALMTTSLMAQREFGFDNRKPTGQAYLSPEETVAKMQVADGFEVKLFAGEPMMTNPIACCFDERGRLWVIESFEYPKRTPPGKMPRDRIKILEDTDGDGKADKSTIFAEGKDFPKRFDMASGIEVGHGGVFVGAAPYLWFLKDTNGDDKADSFEILLQGFGSEDTHEVLNTFQWGPDGGLYGLHGVFTRSKIDEIKMDAAVWRYDVPNKKFEIFAEGTSNPWGMDYTNAGDHILACCVIPHLFHISPGGLYKRQAGVSQHPYAYGLLNEICDHTFHRESGWAHAGLVSLDTPLMPERFRNSVIFGSIHGSSLKQNILAPKGSTFTARKGDDFLRSGDRNVRPVNLRWGPHGDIYMIDWHDQHPCHQTPPDAWDYDRGRVYRIQRTNRSGGKPENLGQLRDAELVAKLGDANPYTARTALRLLTERKALDDAGTAALRERLAKYDLPAIWLLHSWRKLGPVDSAWLIAGLDAKQPLPVRRWLTRMIGDLGFPQGEMLKAVTSAAKNDPSPVMRLELVSLVRKHPKAEGARDLMHRLLAHSEDHTDPVIPLMAWLAYEKQIAASSMADLDWLAVNAPGNPLLTEQIVGRTMRRLVAEGKPAEIAACVQFVAKATDARIRKRALDGLAEGMANRTLAAPPEWFSLRAKLQQDPDAEIRKLADRLAVSFRDEAVLKQALARAIDRNAPLPERLEAMRNLSLARPNEAQPGILALAIDANTPQALRLEAIRALVAYEQPEIATALLTNFASQPAAIQTEILQLLAGRQSWAKAMLAAVTDGRVPRTAIGDNLALRIRAFNQPELNATLEKVWGRYRTTPAELAALIEKTRTQVDTGSASFTRGRKVFENTCAKCHQFDGIGAEVGPKLDGAARDLEYLIGNVMDPNRVIGAPYYVRLVELANGRVESGLLVEDNDQQIVIKVENAVLKIIPKKDVESVQIVEKSVMPEGLASGMSAQDFRDLLRYTMVHPFIPTLEIATTGSPTRVHATTTGRFTLPASNQPRTVTATVIAPSAMTTRLLVGNSIPITITTPKPQAIPAGTANQPDQQSLEITLKPGENTITLTIPPSREPAPLFLRLLDPDRKLRYTEPDLPQ